MNNTRIFIRLLLLIVGMCLFTISDADYLYGQNHNSNIQIESIAVSELSINSIPQSLGKEIFNILLTKLKQKASQVVPLTSTMIQNHPDLNFSLSLAFFSDRDIKKIGRAYKVTHVLTGVAVKLNDALMVSIKILDCNREQSKHVSVNCYEISKDGLNKSIDQLIKKCNIKFIDK